MQLYRVIHPSFIGDRIVEPGEEVSYAGLPGDNLEAIGDAENAIETARCALWEEADRLGIALPLEATVGAITLALRERREARIL